ncbi:hypothetical protein Pcac1_g9990 [Phytophthora cactorum]|nr:hypothetical protein Pcac1_g9990 [Phytophthora cactorum]
MKPPLVPTAIVDATMDVGIGGQQLLDSDGACCAWYIYTALMVVVSVAGLCGAWTVQDCPGLLDGPFGVSRAWYVVSDRLCGSSFDTGEACTWCMGGRFMKPPLVPTAIVDATMDVGIGGQQLLDSDGACCAWYIYTALMVVVSVAGLCGAWTVQDCPGLLDGPFGVSRAWYVVSDRLCGSSFDTGEACTWCMGGRFMKPPLVPTAIVDATMDVGIGGQQLLDSDGACCAWTVQDCPGLLDGPFGVSRAWYVVSDRLCGSSFDTGEACTWCMGGRFMKPPLVPTAIVDATMDVGIGGQQLLDSDGACCAWYIYTALMVVVSVAGLCGAWTVQDCPGLSRTVQDCPGLLDGPFGVSRAWYVVSDRLCGSSFDTGEACTWCMGGRFMKPPLVPTAIVDATMDVGIGGQQLLDSDGACCAWYIYTALMVVVSVAGLCGAWTVQDCPGLLDGPFGVSRAWYVVSDRLCGSSFDTGEACTWCMGGRFMKPPLVPTAIVDATMDVGIGGQQLLDSDGACCAWYIYTALMVVVSVAGLCGAWTVQDCPGLLDGPFGVSRAWYVVSDRLCGSSFDTGEACTWCMGGRFMKPPLVPTAIVDATMDVGIGGQQLLDSDGACCAWYIYTALMVVDCPGLSRTVQDCPGLLDGPFGVSRAWYVVSDRLCGSSFDTGEACTWCMGGRFMKPPLVPTAIVDATMDVGIGGQQLLDSDGACCAWTVQDCPGLLDGPFGVSRAWYVVSDRLCGSSFDTGEACTWCMGGRFMKPPLVPTAIVDATMDVGIGGQQLLDSDGAW